MDYSLAIAAQISSHKRWASRERSEEDMFYEQHALESFSKVKRDVLKLWHKAVSLPFGWMRRDDWVKRNV